MGISDHYRGGMTERLMVTIVTVDPISSRVEVVGKDAAVIQIDVSQTSAIFVWPVQGEVWTIIRENGEWALEGKLLGPDDTQLSTLSPGEALLQAEKFWTPSGDHLVVASENHDIPPGGTTGQVLAKNTNGDWDTGWATRALVTPLVSSLPGSPVDGQECYYQNTAMAAFGLTWQFRYRAGSASGFKWEFIGGPPWTEMLQISEQRSNAAYGHLATVGPQIPIPLTGEYLIAWGARIQSAVGVGGGAEGFAGLAVNGVAFGGAYYVGFVASAQFNGGSAASETNPVAMNNTQTLQIMYATQAAITFAFNNRWLRIIPVRVS